jgi:hypothetical protein
LDEAIKDMNEYFRAGENQIWLGILLYWRFTGHVSERALETELSVSIKGFLFLLLGEVCSVLRG